MTDSQTHETDRREGGLASILLDHPAEADDAVAYWFDGQASLSELRRAAEQAAEAIRSSGIHGRQPVAHIVDSGVTALGVMFGVWLAGAVYVPINGRQTDSEIDSQLNATEPAAVIAARGLHGDDTTAWVEEHTGRTCTLVVSKPWHGVTLRAGTALMMRTSGTTGTAKPVLLTHHGVTQGIDTLLSSLSAKRPASQRPARPPMPNLIPTSLALWAGIWNVLFAMRAGAPAVLMDRFDTVQFAELIRRHQIRSTVLAPAMMAMLVEDPQVQDLAPLTLARSVTAPLTPQQAWAFNQKFGVGIMNGYGQTELGGEVVGWTAADLRDHGDTKLGSVGRPHQGIDVRILDPDGADVPPGGIGDVWIRSPFATQDPQVTDTLIDGFMRTGDLGRLDPDGFLWLEGRASDVINRGGLKVLPQEVEEQLCALPAIADACVAGVPDERLGEVPMAWVRAAPGATVEQNAVLDALRETLSGYKVPVAVEVVNNLPRNEIGKVLRRELIEQWNARSEARASGRGPAADHAIRPHGGEAALDGQR